MTPSGFFPLLVEPVFTLSEARKRDKVEEEVSEWALSVREDLPFLLGRLSRRGVYSVKDSTE